MSLFYIAAFCAVLTSVKVPPQHVPALEAIEKRYAQLAKCFADGDTTTMLSLRDKAFTVRFQTGYIADYDAMAADMRAFFARNEKPIQAKIEVKKALFLAPDSALIVSHQKVSRYQELAGKRRKVEHEATQNDLWVLRADGWKMRGVDFIRNQRRWVDGKGVDPSKAYDPKAPEFKPPKPSFE